MRYPKIELYINGRIRDVARLGPDDVDLEDLAHTLAKINRFIGHTEAPYSVAQHAVLVSHLCPDEQAYECLHHDDAEAYVGDIPSPIKKFLGKKFRSLEARVRARAIAPALGLAKKEPVYVKKWDRVALALEQFHRQDRREIRVAEWDDQYICSLVSWNMSWQQAANLYLARHRQLTE